MVILRFYLETGDLSRADSTLRDSLARTRKAFGDEHWLVGRSLTDLAVIHQLRGELASARDLYEQSVGILDRTLGEQHLFVGIALNNLASLLVSTGETHRALAASRRALEINRALLGDKHATTGKMTANLGMLAWHAGDRKGARALLEEGARIVENAVGPQHPDLAGVLSQLARFSFHSGELGRATLLVRRSLGIRREHLAVSAAVLSERQQIRMVALLRRGLDDWLSYSPLVEMSIERQYAEILAWKGSVLSHQSRVGSPQDNPESAQLLTRLAWVNQEISTLAWRVPGAGHIERRVRKLGELTDRKASIERDLGRHRVAEEAPTPKAIRHALPKGTVLVDFFVYRHQEAPGEHAILDPGGSGLERGRRLVAFVLHADHSMKRIELGAFEPIVKMIARWRQTFTVDLGLELRKRLWAPIETSLSGAETVLISPDGALGRVAWSALPGSMPGTYLLEERAIGIVSTPRDLPGLLARERTKTTMSLLLIGNVDYGARPGQRPDLVASRSPIRGLDAPRTAFSPLLHTGHEIRTIQESFERSFPRGRVSRLERGRATESAFRDQAPNHVWLHLATHGFFEETGFEWASPTSRLVDASSVSLFATEGLVGFHPGLSSGLALSGANRAAQANEDDGLLTALELSALPLESVELAVLSACETGLGPTIEGEGVLGLQRALQATGVRTSLVSLWSVDDLATRKLMAQFYENLWEKGLSKLEALRQAQLSALAAERSAPAKARGTQLDAEIMPMPPAWAGFVLNGDWR